MKKILIAIGLGLIASPSFAISEYEGATNRGGSWVKSGGNLIFNGDRLNGTILKPNMSINVKLDGNSISGCKATKSRSNPKGLRVLCSGVAPNSTLNNKPDGLGIFTN